METNISKLYFLHLFFRTALFVAIFSLFFTKTVHSDPPFISDILVTDVSDRAFSVVWTSDQDGQAMIEVYKDEAGSIPVQNHQIGFYPVATGHPFDENRQASRDSIIQSAKAMGIVKATVSGLSPGADYYVKVGLETELLESTYCPDPDSIYCPGSVGLTYVRTALAPTRIFDSGTDKVFENDLLLMLDQNVGLGELVIIGVEYARYPVTVFAGDGAPLPYLIIDFNNLFGMEYSMRIKGGRESSMGNHGEAIIIRRYMGNNGDVTELRRMANVTGQGEALQSVPVSLGDCNGDTFINGYDALLMEHFLAGTFSSEESSIVAFHPVLCNLYSEEGRHSVELSVNIDNADLQRLRGLLIGNVIAENLPETP